MEMQKQLIFGMHSLKLQVKIFQSWWIHGPEKLVTQLSN